MTDRSRRSAAVTSFAWAPWLVRPRSMAACGWDGGSGTGAQAQGVQPDQRLGRREGPVLTAPDGAGIPGVGQNTDAEFPGVLHHLQSHRLVPRAGRSSRLETGDRRTGPKPDSSHTPGARDPAEPVVHRQASLCRGLDRDRAPGPVFRCPPSLLWLSRNPRPGISGSTRSTAATTTAGTSPAPCIRRRSWPTRITTARWTMKRGAPLRLYSPVKLGYKLTKYLSGDDLYPGTAGRLLGRPGVPLVRRSLTEILHLDGDLGRPIGLGSARSPARADSRPGNPPHTPGGSHFPGSSAISLISPQ